MFNLNVVQLLLPKENSTFFDRISKEYQLQTSCRRNYILESTSKSQQCSSVARNCSSAKTSDIPYQTNTEMVLKQFNARWRSSAQSRRAQVQSFELVKGSSARLLKPNKSTRFTLFNLQTTSECKRQGAN